MFYICRKNSDGSYGVMDTSDNVVENYTVAQISKFVKSLGLSIGGCTVTNTGIRIKVVSRESKVRVIQTVRDIGKYILIDGIHGKRILRYGEGVAEAIRMGYSIDELGDLSKDGEDVESIRFDIGMLSESFLDNLKSSLSEYDMETMQKYKDAISDFCTNDRASDNLLWFLYFHTNSAAELHRGICNLTRNKVTLLCDIQLSHGNEHILRYTVSKFSGITCKYEFKSMSVALPKVGYNVNVKPEFIRAYSSTVIESSDIVPVRFSEHNYSYMMDLDAWNGVFASKDYRAKVVLDSKMYRMYDNRLVFKDSILPMGYVASFRDARSLMDVHSYTLESRTTGGNTYLFCTEYVPNPDWSMSYRGSVYLFNGARLVPLYNATEPDLEHSDVTDMGAGLQFYGRMYN